MLHPFQFLYSTIILMPLFIASLAIAEPIDIAADEISRTADGVVVARGNVVIKRQWDTLMADEVTYRAKEHVLEAKGHVVISSDKATIQTDEAIMQTQSNTGFMNQAVIILPSGDRLIAERVRRIDDQTYEAEEIIFSSCPIDEESWRLAASHAVLNQQDGSLTSKHARFELWGVPVLYSPWWQQSLRRKSGLLMPSVAIGKRRGTEISIPYYIAPQANWDATLTPHWMSARGLMGEAEFRHISQFGYEKINIAGINDAVTNSIRSRLEGDVSWQLPGNMQLTAKADHVSDHVYIADYATGNQIRSSYLQSMAILTQAVKYQDFLGSWSLQGVHQQNLTLQSNATTLQIVPRLQSHAEWALSSAFRLNLDQQSTRFSRRNGVDGWRVNIHPYIEIPWQLETGGISAVLKAGTQHTRYWLQNNNLAATTASRTTGEASLEVRLDFERIGTRSKEAENPEQRWRHVLSPILRYDYITAPNQTALPNFDSGFGLLTWNNLLSGNRFSGLDRIERSNRFSVLFENRLQFKDTNTTTTRDVLIMRAGVSYDLLQQSIDTALQATPVRGLSDLLAEVIWNPISNVRVFGSGQYNPAERYWANITAAVNIASTTGNQLNVAYQFTDARYATEIQLLNLNSKFVLNGRWRATANWQYDLLLKFSQQTSLGLQYQHPCWTVGAEAYKNNSPLGTGTSSNFGFHLLLEFKGLGSVGS